MVIGRVVGSVVATQKNESFVGSKMLLVQPLDLDGNDYGQEILAIDTQDAGPGDIVLVVSEGNSSRQAIGKTDAPVDSVIIGVVDTVRISRRFEGR
ncbi:MAG: EutN/CcmL family microcompartment protein [Firmicutes bacterium]|nr:EutN/CcmL family microcompartment protein [Bacillota bacterium]MDH7495437.1 EutN/CcmL family microcompartment protein [Bacillota bacterium]